MLDLHRISRKSFVHVIGYEVSSRGAMARPSRRYASPSVVGMTGIAFGWIGPTIAFGVVVRKPSMG